MFELADRQFGFGGGSWLEHPQSPSKRSSKSCYPSEASKASGGITFPRPASDGAGLGCMAPGLGRGFLLGARDAQYEATCVASRKSLWSSNRFKDPAPGVLSVCLSPRAAPCHRAAFPVNRVESESGISAVELLPGECSSFSAPLALERGPGRFQTCAGTGFGPQHWLWANHAPHSGTALATHRSRSDIGASCYLAARSAAFRR